MRWTDILRSVASCAVLLLAQGCASTQTATSTVQMVDSIARIRNQQVLRNLAAIIKDHDAVPSQIVLGVGQANVSVGVSPVAKATNLTHTPSLEGDVGLVDQWTAQWQFTAITDPGDLRRLRNLYALVVASDEEYQHLSAVAEDVEKEEASAAAATSLQRPAYGDMDMDDEDRVFQGLFPQDGRAGAAGGGPVQTEAKIADWRTAKRFVTKGDSIGCRQYQAARDTSSRLPFRRWLFWRSVHAGAGSAWQPSLPATQDIHVLGTVGGVQIATTSRACFDDFVILVQALSSTTNAAAKAPRYMLQ